jgi:hypothetical protein
MNVAFLLLSPFCLPPYLALTLLPTWTTSLRTRNLPSRRLRDIRVSLHPQIQILVPECL